jgi:hypothetical protein
LYRIVAVPQRGLSAFGVSPTVRIRVYAELGMMLKNKQHKLLQYFSIYIRVL